MEFIKNNLSLSFSPEVTSTLLWFLKRWTKTYISTDAQIKLSPSLAACFDLRNECGKFNLKLLLDIVELHLSMWTAEPQVSEDVVKLLLRLLNEKTRYSVMLLYHNCMLFHFLRRCFNSYIIVIFTIHRA